MSLQLCLIVDHCSKVIVICVLIGCLWWDSHFRRMSLTQQCDFFCGTNYLKYLKNLWSSHDRVRNLKFATYLKFATGENTNKINELW